MSRFRFEAGILDCEMISDSVLVISLSSSVLGRFLWLVNSRSVDCGVGVCRACILEVDEVAKEKGFSSGFSVGVVVRFNEQIGIGVGSFERNDDERTGQLVGKC